MTSVDLQLGENLFNSLTWKVRKFVYGSFSTRTIAAEYGTKYGLLSLSLITLMVKRALPSL